jgi:uncharacterized membrane protein
VLLHLWMSVFGHGDGAVRALSGVIALLTLPLAWVVGRRRGGRLLAWLFTAVMAMSPFALRYATETRMYSLLMAGTLALYLLVDDVAREGRTGWPRLVALAVLSGLLLLTHYWAIWLLGAVELLLIWHWYRRPDRRRAVGFAFVAIALGGILFLPWLPSFLYQAAHTGTPWAGRVRPSALVGSTVQDFGGGGFPDAVFVGTVMVALALLGLFGRGTEDLRIDLDLRTRPLLRPEASVLALTLALGGLVALVTASTYQTRYAAVVYPLFGLLVAAGLACFVSPRLLTGALAVLLALCLFGAYWNVTYPRSQARVDDRAINAIARPGDVVIYCPDQLGPAFSRQLRPGLDQAAYPTLGSPLRVNWVDYAKRNAAADPTKIAGQILDRAEGKPIFLVWQGSYRTFGMQCETLFDTLAAARPGGRTLVASGGSKYYEPAGVTYFPAPR